jgi:hypothetical protein
MLQIHRECTMHDAIADFGGHGEVWCDDQFAVLPRTVLCFIVVGPGTDDPHLSQPSTVVWKPKRLDYAPDDEYPWLPTPVRDVYDRSGPRVVRLRTHHLFLRTVRMTGFYYIGEAHLGCYSGPRGIEPGNREACFSLNEKVSPKIWQTCGGYTGWKVELDHEEQVISDFSAMENVLCRLRSDAYSHLFMTRYEEDSLTIHTNPQGRAWLMYLSQPDDSGLYVNNPGLGTELQNFRCGCGIDLDFPANQTLPCATAIKIARSLYEAGELPNYVDWTPEY